MVSIKDFPIEERRKKITTKREQAQIRKAFERARKKKLEATKKALKK